MEKKGTEKQGLNKEELSTLLRLAKRAIIDYTLYGKIDYVALESLEKPNITDKLKEKAGAFVTLYKMPGKELRGCIGYPYPIMPLYKAVIESAREATEDPRFPKLRKEELKDIVVEVSVLSPPKAVEGKSVEEKVKKIKEFEDGVILSYYGRRALFLPQVWKELPDKEEFLSQLALKAGLPKDIWKNEGVEFYTFRVETIEGKLFEKVEE